MTTGDNHFKWGGETCPTIHAMAEYGAFLGDVGGGEGSRCNHTLRLDTYGCGCAHNCSYCYARSILAFRGLWHPDDPSVADLRKIEKALDGIEPGTVLRLGGLTDCFQPIEEQERVTLGTLRLMHERGIHSLIVTKSHLVAESPWIDELGPLDHIQVSITSTSDEPNPFGERASKPSMRLRAIQRLSERGLDVQARLSPYVPELVDLEAVRAVTDRVLVEFLRVNGSIRKVLKGLDLSPYRLKLGGYRHLPLRTKREWLEPIREMFPEVSVCEDVYYHWSFWMNEANANPNDCCNLKGV